MVHTCAIAAPVATLSMQSLDASAPDPARIPTQVVIYKMKKKQKNPQTLNTGFLRKQAKIKSCRLLPTFSGGLYNTHIHRTKSVAAFILRTTKSQKIHTMVMSG